MIIKFNIENVDNSKEEDYINKPIIKNGQPIGTITKVEIEKDIVKIEAEIWSRFVNNKTEYYIDCNRKIFNSMEIEVI